MALNEELDRYRRKRSFDSPAASEEFLKREYVFHRTKRLYFDEVENANVWSFYLVERDLHHTFEEFIMSLGLPPYAIWSKHGTNAVKEARVTFPISETAAIFKAPVPTAGMAIEYALEVLHVGKKSAVFGFLGFLHGELSGFAQEPSVVAAWLRVLVEYTNGARKVIPLPDDFKERLGRHVSQDFRWTQVTA
jgi:acyl-CoA thioesterase FadM